MSKISRGVTLKVSVAIKISFDLEDKDKVEKIQKILKKLQDFVIVEDLEAVEGTNVYKLVGDSDGQD